jgi:predicted transcriptional regulator
VAEKKILYGGLKLITKIIQNLANNIQFGKEAHMTVLNPFLKDNIVTVTKFLSEVNVRRTRARYTLC